MQTNQCTIKPLVFQYHICQLKHKCKCQSIEHCFIFEHPY